MVIRYDIHICRAIRKAVVEAGTFDKIKVLLKDHDYFEYFDDMSAGQVFRRIFNGNTKDNPTYLDMENDKSWMVKANSNNGGEM